MSDTSVSSIASDVDPALHRQLFEFLLALGDDALILGHRLSEWCGHAPQLEEDIALANIALDEIGRANVLLMYAGQLDQSGRDQDGLAFHRDPVDFRNLLLVEQPNGNFGDTIARQFLFDTFALALFECLSSSTSEMLAGIARKSAKEIRYHVRHSRRWVVMLGDGTAESKERIQLSFDNLWTYTDEMFRFGDDTNELITAGIIPAEILELKKIWLSEVSEALEEATLIMPDGEQFMRYGGREGRHSEHLGHILDEMQFLARSHPGATW